MSIFSSLKRLLPNSLKSAMKRQIASRLNAYKSNQTKWMLEAIEQVQFERQLNRVVKEAQPAFEAVQPKSNLRLNLGAGMDLKQGWINIDLFSKDYLRHHQSESDATCIRYDLRRRIPLPDNSCEYIYSSHFIEHMVYEDAVQFIKNCYDLLQSGGILRLSLPDFRRCLEAYVEGESEFYDLIDIGQRMPYVEPETYSMIDYVNYLAYQNGEHKSFLDADKLHKLFDFIGFQSSRVTTYKEEIDPPGEIRRRYSLYIEAIK